MLFLDLFFFHFSSNVVFHEEWVLDVPPSDPALRCCRLVSASLMFGSFLSHTRSLLNSTADQKPQP